MPDNDVEFTAMFSTNDYTITFDTDGGSAIDPITAKYGTAVTAPTSPTKTGYTFKGWEPALPSTIPAGNLTVKAQWQLKKETVELALKAGLETGNLTVTGTPGNALGAYLDGACIEALVTRPHQASALTGSTACKKAPSSSNR